MSDKKIVNQLPVVLQTKAIKNFFEATVEQLYSEANTVPLAGFIGKKTGSDVGLSGAFIKEDNADRRQYNLTPAVNNINPVTGDSENLIFYDEFIDTLNVYGVNTSNHNKLFGSQYRAFVPPINIDKFVNYQEYYWQPAGIGAITVTGTAIAPINLHKDVLGKKQFTSGTVTLKDGMTVTFNDNGYTIPANSTTMPEKAGVEYIVSGVGESIVLVKKDLTASTEYGGSKLLQKDYIVQQRGAVNKNAWSRVNHWYHRSSFVDAGEQIPKRTSRANRPILEFSKDLELYDHGSTSYGIATAHVTGITKADVVGQVNKTIDTRVLQDGDILLFSNEDASNKTYLYTVSGINTGITLTPTSSTPIATGQTVTIAGGNVFKGIDYKFNGTDYSTVQRKISTNQAPLFQLYDDAGKLLSNGGLYNNSDFAGNPIFGYKVGTGAVDTELGFAVTYTPYKSVSEITFENYIHTNRTTYMPFGTTTAKTILGTYYYKLLKETPEFHSTWKQSLAKNEQKIITTHYITQLEVDDEQLVYNIGAIPDTATVSHCGYDILVKVNGVISTNYEYAAPTNIKLNTFTVKAGDVIDIEVGSEVGITLISDSRYDVPLSWKANPFNKEIELIAEPEYMSHFKRYIERQDGFTGSALGANNFANTSKDIIHAKDIVQTDQDLIVAAFALDDQPHNLVDALRFSAREYEKYRARLINEINAYYNKYDITNLSKEYILEQVLRSLISFSIGKDVFGTTFVLPFGDNYIKQEFDVADIAAKVYTLDDYADLSEITNSLLVYHVDASNSSQDLLVIDKDYELTSLNPITVSVIKELNLGDTVITKLYDEDRDSAECPATPSTMGLYPLYSPAVVTDNTFKIAQSLLLGHDGSKTSLLGDIRDDILLEFERRLYNSTAQEFRKTDSLPRLSVGNVRAGAFRTTTQSPREYADLLRNSFTNWAKVNKVDASTNEFYKLTDKTSWNYRGTNDAPGHWKGWFEYYYDTARPHTHPWEMLGFISEPTWWLAQYGTNTTKSNETLWYDLEQGIIRSGKDENFISSEYLTDNPWRRVGLSNLLPVDYTNNLLTPGEITDTGSTTKNETWTNSRVNNTLVTDAFVDTAGTSNLPNGINITYSASSVFVEDITTARSYQLYNYTVDDISDTGGTPVNENVALADKTIAITVTGTPINNHANVSSWQGGNEWFYSKTYRNESVENAVYTITPESAGLTAWSTTEHSPIVGWAFDGLPIYGPYGYTKYDSAGTLANADAANNNITNIKSAFELRTGQRTSGPAGIHTGEFVQDYTYNAGLGGTDGYVGHASKGFAAKYNMRWGTTPESPTTPIYFYVATQDVTGAPMFPYAIGGTVDSTNNTYSGYYYAAPVEKVLNNKGKVTARGALIALSSTFSVQPSSNLAQISAPWRFGDGAPVENAWKYSAGYSFAITEAMLLSQPGRFITMFSDPLRNSSPVLSKNKIINTVDRTPFDFADEDHFCIHGAVNTAGNVITNVGYSQFIHSWLTYQSLNTTTDYADKLKKVNIKLAHRVAGFTDKDTLTVKTDQQSLSSTTTSLIIPSENIDVIVHASPYKNRNFYTGINIEKTANGYKVKGFDKNAGYFNVLRRNLSGRTTSVQVGGDAVDFTNWESGVTYQKNSIVEYNNSYYEAPTLVTSSQTFTQALWKRLPSLPQTGAVRGVLYLDDLPYIDRIDYDTLYTTFQDVVNVLVGLGAYQESIGFTFGEFDSAIADVRNWNYVVKQFLFFVAGGWETNNTLELSPLATTVRFTSKTGMVAKINRVDRNQFTLIDQDGRAIQPSECSIVRAGNSIEITPPAGIQVYGALLHTKEIEHALVFDNVTDFNDTLFDPVYSQGQNRLRIKGKKTANWSGLFSSEGFIIQGDELRPNLDNMAQSLGRYHELGFIPVEKQIYEQARGLFGYQEREYLNNLELEDDDQFEFYKGMLQSKGTLPSLSKLAKSKNIISGEMAVYDEWAIKVGDFGDLENDQSIELKLTKSDVLHDPQLITLAFPEDTTGTIDRVDVIDTAHTYYDAPTIEISVPTQSPKQQATATSVLKADGTLAAINIANAGTGYTTESARLNVVAGELSIANVSTQFTTSTAASTAPVVEPRLVVNDGNLVIGTKYQIKTLGDSDFTSVGATQKTANQIVAGDHVIITSTTGTTGDQWKAIGTATDTPPVGEVFVATAAGIGTGTVLQAAFTATGQGNASATGSTIATITGLTNLTITAVGAGASNVNIGPVNIDVSGVASLANIADLVNADTTIKSHITANSIESKIQVGSGMVRQSVLSFIGTDFMLTEQGSTLSGLNLTAGRYEPTQRFAIAAVGNHPTKGTGATTSSDITVKVNNAIVDSSYWAYDAGSRQQTAFVILTAGAGGNTEGNVVVRGDVNVPITTIASENIETIDDVVYPYVTVFIDGYELINAPGNQQFDLTATTLTLRNVENLPDNGIAQGANVFLVERPTVNFASTYFDDVPAAKLNIKVATNDNIAIITSVKRLHEITPDLKTDDAILIDIDDTSRFLKKPIGARQTNLWPTTTDVDATGITDAKYISIPNAGYVNNTTVDFSSFDVPSISDMFRSDILIHPDTDNIVHVAISENEDWNVYQFKEFASTVKFIEQEANDQTAHLYTTESLFDTTTDQNQLASGIDSTRYLDYHIAVKDAVIDNKFVVWVNEQTVNQKQVRLSNITPVAMMEESVTNIGPNTVSPITNVTPGVSGFAVAEASAADGTGTVTITTSVEMLDSVLAGTIGFASGNITASEQIIHGQTYTASNVNIQAGTCTITEAGVTAPIDAGNLTARFFNRTTIESANHGYAAGEMIKIVAGTSYSGQWIVEGASTDTFIIDTPYLSSGPTTGNILLPEFKITTTNDHGMENDYSGKKIAIHNADQRYYNGVYRVKNIPTANTIVVWDSFPFADEANTNVNGTPSTTCVVTTLDHNVISLNNSIIKIDNINSLPGMIDALNDTIETRAGMVTHQGSFGISINMLKFPMFGPNGTTPNKIGGALPNLTSFGNLSTKNLQVTGNKTINQIRAGLVGFNKNKNGVSTIRKNPRSVTSAATAKTRSSTLNTTPFNPIIPSLYSGQVPNFIGGPINAGIGGSGPGYTTINLGGTGGYNGGYGMGYVQIPNVPGNPAPTPAPSVTPIPIPASPVVNIGPKIIPTANPKIRPNYSNGSVVLTATAVLVAPLPKCGELIIPVPPRPPQVPNTPANGNDDAFSTPFDTVVTGNVLTNDTVGLIKEGIFQPGNQYTIVTTGDTDFVSLGAANNSPGTVFTSNGTGLQGGTGVARFPLTSTIVAPGASFGTVSLSSNGNFTYTPNSGFSGIDVWFYNSNDGHGSGSVQEVAISVGQKVPPAPVVYEKCEYQEQSTTANRTGNQAGGFDHFTYMIPASGKVKIIMDFDGAPDILEAIQIQQKNQTTGKRKGFTGATVRKATAAEKEKIKTSKAVPAYANHIGGKHRGYNPNTSNGNFPQDFTKSGDGIKYCGVIEFNFNPGAGSYLKLKIQKLSNVYRYVICYPTTTKTGKIAPSTPAGNYTGAGSAAPKWTGYKATPTYSPTGQPTTKPKISIGNVMGGGGIQYLGRGGWAKKAQFPGVTYVHNYGGFSAAPMAGYTHMPSVFKKTVKTVNPQNIGRPADLTNNRYVNNTLQRVSGGNIIPLSAALQKPIRIPNRGINGLNLSMYPGSSHLGNSGTMKNITVEHQLLKIGSSNYDLQNLSNPGSAASGATNGFNSGGNTSGYGTNGTGGSGTNSVGSTSGIPGFSNAVFTTTPAGPPTIIPGASVYDSTNSGNAAYGRSLTPPETLSSDDSPITDGIDFTIDPVITFQPIKDIENPDGTKRRLPAGPVVDVELTRPTPGAVVTEDDLIGMVPGDEFIINNRSISIKGTPAATLREIECSAGFGYTTMPTTKNGKTAIKISSCGSAPITLRDGCRGGAYKEVLDFHIVRSFQQLGMRTAPFISESDANGVTTTTTGLYPIGLYNINGTPATMSTGSVSMSNTSDGNVVTQTPTNTSTTTFTGGSGYTVGDRLRVIGGTPVASPFGSIRELCIEIPGANYSSEGNVKVFVGDGTSPGSKAEAIGVTFDEQNGISTIIMGEGGYGYDPARPPVIRIIDTGAGSTPTQLIPCKVRAIIKTEQLNAQGVYVETKGTPDRVAKFVVTAVDPDTNAILGLSVIDRGVYKQFPSDLSTGIPLEYDYPNIGDSASSGGSGLGEIDPVTGQVLPEPGTYVPSAGKYGSLTGHGQAGSGARIFLTAREIPDCSEKADVLSKLGLPDVIRDYSTTEHLADLINAAFLAAGYDPNSVTWSITPINDDIDQLNGDFPDYDGIIIDERTPGILEKLGLPAGSYDNDIGKMTVVDGTPQNDKNLTDAAGINDAINGGLGGLGNGGDSGLGNGGDGGLGIDGTGDNGNNASDGTGTELPEETMVIYGVDNGGFRSDGSSMLGGANATYVGDLYQYELRNLDGTFVSSTNDARDAKVLYLESLRYASSTANVVVRNGDDTNISTLGNVWVDDYEGKGWAYLNIADGSKNRYQEALVDPKYIKNTIIYDSTTGQKDFDYDMWDPFKGVLPAFVDAEITYTGKSDPVVYTTQRAVFGKPNVGQVWWDTSTVRYNWYEQGTNRERWLNWGSTFPGSAITVYEWVESKVTPLEYADAGGTGTPKNGSEFIIERRLDPVSNLYINCYYYWVQNVSTISTLASQLAGRKTSTFNLARYLADPIGQGLNTVSYISAGVHERDAVSIANTNVASFVMGNLTKTLREDEQNIQINLSRNINPVGLKHASWKLLRENDNNSTVPEDIALKLIDSLCEIDAAGNKVPADNLSEIERYGVAFRPRQTMFKKPKQARRVLQYILNEILADTKLNTLYPGWDSAITTNTYIETINWFDVKRVDDITNAKIRFDNTYKASFTVASVKELDKLNSNTIVDGTIVMVKAGKSDRFQLWRWNPTASKFYQIAIEKETVKLKDTIYTDDANTTMQTELRALLIALKDIVFTSTANFNEVFFEMLKYALGEQQELDWAFKTSYIYIEKEEEDLVQRIGFKPDNFNSVTEYMNEVKPYTAKIREYKDGKRAPLEYINEQMLSDFDVPAYPDPLIGEVRTLDFTVGTDRAIMANNSDYTKAYGGYKTDQVHWENTTPVRANKINIVFDRTDWRLLQAGHDASTTSYNVSIGQNIADINANSIVNVSNVASNSYTASGRLFKFDTDVRAKFNSEIDLYYGSGASANTSITTDSTKMQTAVVAGALNGTLYLVKQKVGGTWQGEELDANVFTMGVNGQDSLALQSSFGYDTSPFDYTDGFGSQFDSLINVQNFEGLFSGNSTYREGGVTYSGFDGATFSHVLYGNERPEELVYLSPLENFVMHVVTDTNAYDGNNTPVASIGIGPYTADAISNSVSSVVTITSPQAASLLVNNDVVTLTDEGSTILNASFTIANVTSSTFEIPLAGVDSTIITTAGNVSITSGVASARTEYIVHQDLFGADEYLRVLSDGSGSTSTASVINAWDTEITVINATKLPIPKPGIPGAAWLDNSERIEYLRVAGNKLSGITRGTRGTTIPNGPAYIYVDDVATLSNTYIKHEAGVSVVSAGKSDVFDATLIEGGTAGSEARDPNVANWLKADGSQTSITDITNRNTGSGSTIAAFLHGDSVSSVGFDSKGWDQVGWDSI